MCHLARAVQKAVNTTKQAECKEFLDAQKAYAEVEALDPQDWAAAPVTDTQVHFEPETRCDTVATLREWIGRDVAADPGLDAWVAMTINGEPVKDYVRRTCGVNCDQEERVCARVRQQKKRAGDRIRDALAPQREALQAEAAQSNL